MHHFFRACWNLQTPTVPCFATNLGEINSFQSWRIKICCQAPESFNDMLGHPAALENWYGWSLKWPNWWAPERTLPFRLFKPLFGPSASPFWTIMLKRFTAFFLIEPFLLVGCLPCFNHQGHSWHNFDCRSLASRKYGSQHPNVLFQDLQTLEIATPIFPNCKTYQSIVLSCSIYNRSVWMIISPHKPTNRATSRTQKRAATPGAKWGTVGTRLKWWSKLGWL